MKKRSERTTQGKVKKATTRKKGRGAAMPPSLIPGKTQPGGAIVVIGGHEDKKGDRKILAEVAKLVKGGPFVVATLASEVPGELWDDYEPIFRDLGLEPYHLDLEKRDDGYEKKTIEVLKKAKGVFFTGGDQLRLTSKLGGSEVCDEIRRMHMRGGVLAGTSAGASVMSETMIVEGPSDVSPKARDALRMAPGLGFLKDMIIDQHFAERGRLGRLAGTIAQNPRMLGVGIDEDTAIVVNGGGKLKVLGKGAVYVLDGRKISHSNVGSKSEDCTMSIFDLTVHVLAEGDSFAFVERRPKAGKKQEDR